MPANSFLRISFKRKRLLKWKKTGTNRIDMKLDRNSSNVMNKISNWKKEQELKSNM